MLIREPGAQDAQVSSLRPTTKKDCAFLCRVHLLFFIWGPLPCRVQFWTWGGGRDWEEKDLWILQREEKSKRTTDPTSGPSRSEASM